MYIDECLYTSLLKSTVYINLDYLGIQNSNVFFSNHFVLALVLHFKDLKMLRVCKSYYCCGYY